MTSDDGRTAMDYASDAGHPDVQMIIERSSRAVMMRLDDQDDLIRSMTTYVDLVSGEARAGVSGEAGATEREPAVVLEGAVISSEAVARGDDASVDATADAGPGREATPPLVMRHYQQRELPLRIIRVEDEAVVVETRGEEIDEMRVEPGALIPESTVEVVRVGRRVEQGKLHEGEPVEVRYVEVRDTRGGTGRTWFEGEPAQTHDPAALVEDAASGRRYLALAGQRFTSEDGRVFVVSDVRPNQLVIIEEATGAAHTLPLRGPRG